MTKHDEVRQILHDAGCKFEDGRTALEMSDEEVEQFMVEFAARMTRLGRQLNQAFAGLGRSVLQAMEPIRDLGKMLAEAGITEDEEEAPSR